MLNTTVRGAIAAGAGGAVVDDLPLSVPGLEGWISTTKGKFLFDDGSTLPADGKAVAEARNVEDHTVLFSQATPGLRPTWDATTFDVPCILGDGTQYLTRAVSLAPPGLIIAACALDSDAAGVDAVTGSRSMRCRAAIRRRMPGR